MYYICFESHNQEFCFEGDEGIRAASGLEAEGRRRRADGRWQTAGRRPQDEKGRCLMAEG